MPALNQTSSSKKSDRSDTTDARMDEAERTTKDAMDVDDQMSEGHAYLSLTCHDLFANDRSSSFVGVALLETGVVQCDYFNVL